MRCAIGLFTLLGLVSVAEFSFVIAQEKQKDKANVTPLIKRLGHVKFSEREKATKALLAIGQPALVALREVRESSQDLETRRRADWIIKALDKSQPMIPCPSDWITLSARYGGDVVSTAVVFFTHTQLTGNRVWLRIEVKDKVVIHHHWAYYQLKPSALPAEFDFHYQGETAFYKGIYRFDGDRLEICLSASGKPRPKEFRTIAGDNQLLIELKLKGQ